MGNWLQYTGIIRIPEAEYELAVEKMQAIPETYYFFKEGFTVPKLMYGDIIVSFGFYRKGYFEDIDSILNLFEQDVLSILPVFIATIIFEAEDESNIVQYSYVRDMDAFYDVPSKDIEWRYEKSLFSCVSTNRAIPYKLSSNENTQH
jgi:hypothetical protein